MITIILLTIIWLLLGLLGLILTTNYINNTEWSNNFKTNTQFKIISIILHLLVGPFALFAGLLHYSTK